MFKNWLQKVGYGVAALAVTTLIASAAGMWWGLPIVGNPGYCASYLNGNYSGGTGYANSNQTCVSQIPAGPPTLTGNELIPADTQLPNGQNPQTEYISSATFMQHGLGAERNALRGGDFNQNLWQRGVTFSSLSPTTTTMTADGWGVYSSGNVATIAKDTTAGDLSPSLGINAAMKITRPSGTNTTAICVVQVLPAREAVRFIGNQAIFSFYAQALSGFLSTNDNIIANIAVYTASDSATPGTNTDAWAKATITGYTVINPTSATVATAPVIPITTSWVRYSVTGTVPTTVSSNAVTGIGVSICTPVYPASTGVAGDGFLIANAQLEVSVAPNATNGTPGNTAPGSFARRQQASEAAYELTYSYVITDGAITRVYGWCQETTVNTSASCIVQFPQEMREVPTTTVSAAGWSVQQTNATNELCSALAGVTSSNTILNAELLCTNPGTIAIAVMSPFLGGATTSTMTYSAEP